MKLSYLQIKNIKTAVQCLLLLTKMGFEISKQEIKEGLLSITQQTGIKGRWQVLGEKPKIVCDTAHNREGLLSVMSQILSEEFNQLRIVLGVVNDKDLKNILRLLPEEATYYFCKPNIPRGLPASSLQEQALNYGLHGEMFGSVVNAFEAAVEHASKDDFIFVGGSTFVVAELDL